MKNMLICCCIFGISQPLFGQRDGEYSYFTRSQRVEGGNDTKIEVNKKGDTTLVAYYASNDAITNSHREFIKTYKGTPFFMNGWYKGNVRANGLKDSEFLMAFNVEKRVLHIVTDASKDAISIKPDEFTIKGHTFNRFENRFFETIYDKKSIVLKENLCVMSPTNVFEKSSYDIDNAGGGFEGEFVKSYNYFWLKDNELRLITKGKKIANLFDSNKSLVQEFILKNKINPKTEAGILEIFKYYDSLNTEN
jgi:hypothetical protein